jgi:hypothetical protein
MEYALKPLPIDPLDPPAGLTKVAVGRESGKLWVEGCPEAKVEDYVPTGQAPTERCEKPTPTPTATPSLSTELERVVGAAGAAERTPRPTGTPLPSVEELRERAVFTATAAAGYAQTAVAERRATMTAIPSITPYPRPRTEVEVAGVQVTRTPAIARSPTPTRTPAGR